MGVSPYNSRMVRVIRFLIAAFLVVAVPLQGPRQVINADVDMGGNAFVDTIVNIPFPENILTRIYAWKR